MTERSFRARETGFTLLEVLVAFAVLSVSLAAIMSIYSTAFRSAASAASYATATQLAESKLAEIAGSESVPDAIAGGRFAGRYEWAAVVSPLEWQDAGGEIEHPLRPFRLSVEVSWREAGRDYSIALNAVKLARRQ